MSEGLLKITEGWSHLYLGEARNAFEKAARKGARGRVHSNGRERSILVKTALFRLGKCGCGASVGRECRCLSFVFQDREGIYHFIADTQKQTLIALGFEADRRKR